MFLLFLAIYSIGRSISLTNNHAARRKLDLPVILVPLLIIFTICALLIAFPEESQRVIVEVRDFITDTFGWY